MSNARQKQIRTRSLLRRYVREVLVMASPHGVTEDFLHDSVNELMPGDVDLTDLRDAVEFNVGDGHVRSAVNDDTEQREWSITKQGIAKVDQR